MKEFTTAVEEHEYNDKDVLELAIDGHELFANRPTDGQIALTMASMGRFSDDTTRMAAIIDFFVSVFDDESHTYIVERLMSREDPLDLLTIEQMLRWMLEEWTGNPTQSPSVSTPSRGNGGPKSRPRTTKSTSSRSIAASS
jgi:hypothetical protein